MAFINILNSCLRLNPKERLSLYDIEGLIVEGIENKESDIISKD